MSEFFPLLNRAMESKESRNGSESYSLTPQEAAAQKLAHQLQLNPNQQQNLDIFKQFLVGSENRTDRISGQRPWPERDIADETWRYTVPVFAGFSNESTVLAVLKDPWHDHKDTNDWLVGELDLPSGSYTEYMVTAVSADSAHYVNLQIADPTWFQNMPPGMRPGPHQPVRNWHRITLQLDKMYMTDYAEIRFGIDTAPQPFYDIEHLGKAITVETQAHTESERFTTRNDLLAQLALSQESLPLKEAA